MKQQLWIVNSSLVGLSVLVFAASEMLKQEAPVLRIKRAVVQEMQKQKDELSPAPSWEPIFQNDMFGTFVAPEIKTVKQSLVTPIPEPRPTIIAAPPEVKKQEFVAPLPITLKGIISGLDETKSVAMIADETQKEGIYHLGEKVKDAQIIKIAQNRVILLRANGQQETFFLRKDDNLIDPASGDKWKLIVKKIDDQTYEVDPQEFVKEVESLGSFIERTSFIGLAYKAGAPIGVRIGQTSPSEVASALGLMQNDVITSVNDLSTIDLKNRMKIYDIITELPIGGTCKVGLKRAEKDIVMSYRLAKIERPRKYSSFPGVTTATQTPAPAPLDLAMGRSQQREATMRDFDRSHNTDSNRSNAIMEIRRRLLENLQNRMRNQRVR
jgi:type II secretory pathway component PulC